MWCWGGSFGGVWACVVEQVKEAVSSKGDMHRIGSANWPDLHDSRFW